jgi:alkylhydroperoxidase/carboxymuconolactone decarboxylase family protein YurZ
MDNKQRELTTLVVLATNQTLPQLKAHAHAALKGLAVQVEIFGDIITKMRESAPSNQKHIQD